MIRAKVCGLSTLDALDAAARHGASHVGFVHHQASPRHLPLADMTALVASTAPGVASVAVVVDPDDDMLDALIGVAPDVLQVHRVAEERVRAIRARWTGGLWVGLPVRDATHVAVAEAYAPQVDRVLFDAPTDPLEVPGGTGRSFDWTVLRRSPPTVPWVLSGGLTPANVRRAIAAAGADFVDVSSGVESAPGVKDVDKIAAFLTACGR